MNYCSLNKLIILIYKLAIIPEKFVAENINYKGRVTSKHMEKRKNEILIWREHWNWAVEFNNWWSKVGVKKFLLFELIASLKTLANFTESII